MRVNAGVLALLLCGGRVDVIQRIVGDCQPSVKRLKLCLLCKSPHSHHNSFRSAECCREHRRRARERAS